MDLLFGLHVFCVLCSVDSMVLVLGAQLFHVTVTQLIIGLGPYFTVYKAGRFGRHTV